MSSIPKSETLRNLYWRSEILRALYWLRGEGLGDLVDVPMLRRYLDVDAGECRARLDDLVADGALDRDGAWYALSAQGLAEGEEELATMFADLARPTSGACSDECWCQFSSDEQAACNGGSASTTSIRTSSR
ncbi:MAG: hypothetical protein ACR2HY_06115 [Acidimicrobiales bacterium]